MPSDRQAKGPARSELTDGFVVARRYRPADAEALHEAAMESLREVGPWLPWCREGLSVEECRSWLERQWRLWDEGEEFEFAVTEPADGTYLGGCGLNSLSREGRMANLGFWVRSSASGRGIATAAARLVSAFGFGTLGLLRIEVVIAVGNPKSQRVAEKLGALREGVLRNRLVLHGRAHDAAMYSLIPP